MSNKLLIGGVVLVVVGLLVFGRFSNNQKSLTNTASVNDSVSTGSAKTNLAPDFRLEKLGGGTISLSEFKGKKPIVIGFWASWCPNCRRDMPNLNRFYEKYKDKVEVIGVNLQENESAVKDFIASRGISFPIAFDPNSQASNAFGIQYTNTHFLLDINGNLARTIPGDIKEEDIMSLIEKANASGSQSSLPDEKPCKIAAAEDGEKAGSCENPS